jgi:basic membrane protein A
VDRLARLAAAMCVALLAACGSTPDDVPRPASGDLCQRATGHGPKVGIAYDVGGRDDRGLNDLAFSGLTRAVKKLDATCLEGEAAEGELESARSARLNHLIDTGARVIVAVGGDYAEAVDDAARAHPRLRFALIDGVAPTEGADKGGRANVAYLDFNTAQGVYVAGAAAALASKSGSVGFIGNELEESFKSGAEAANPKVKVTSTALPLDEATTAEPVDAESIATDQFNSGVDVIFGAPGVDERDLLNAAVDAGDEHWVVGYGSDQYVTASDDQKEHVLTSILKRYDTATYDFLASVAAGRPAAGQHTLGLKQRGLGYSTSGDFVKPIASDLDAFEAKVVAGDVVVPTR